jgi:hypothetical protein
MDGAVGSLVVPRRLMTRRASRVRLRIHLTILLSIYAAGPSVAGLPYVSAPATTPPFACAPADAAVPPSPPLPLLLMLLLLLLASRSGVRVSRWPRVELFVGRQSCRSPRRYPRAIGRWWLPTSNDVKTGKITRRALVSSFSGRRPRRRRYDSPDGQSLNRCMFPISGRRLGVLRGLVASLCVDARCGRRRRRRRRRRVASPGPCQSGSVGVWNNKVAS